MRLGEDERSWFADERVLVHVLVAVAEGEGERFGDCSSGLVVARGCRL